MRSMERVDDDVVLRCRGVRV